MGTRLMKRYTIFGQSQMHYEFLLKLQKHNLKVAYSTSWMLIIVYIICCVQESAMKRGIDILVGTPGRILDHMNRGNLDLSVSAMYIYIDVYVYVSITQQQYCVQNNCYGVSLSYMHTMHACTDCVCERWHALPENVLHILYMYTHPRIPDSAS